MPSPSPSPSSVAQESVVVIDDEPDLCSLLEFNLREAGFAPLTAGTGADGIALAEKVRPSVIVLDLMLPDIPGTEVCRRLRAHPVLGEVPIMVLTARGDEYDRVVGFEMGADDYVVKPFSVREIVLRIRALARRSGERRVARTESDTGNRLRWRGLELDPVRHRVFADGEELGLRPMEYKLIALFLERVGQVFTREQLLEEVWGISADVNTRTVDTHIRRLRERLGDYGAAIETVHGFGYRLREP